MKPRYRHGLVLLMAIFAIRLLVILTAPVDLSGDEAYYWEWGRHLDWGYFSKPPLIGWLMGFSGWIFGDTEWGIRLMALLFGSGSLLLLGRLTRDLFGEEASFWAILAAVLSPGNAAANLIFTIDAPLVFSWTLALYCGYRYMTADGRGAGRWALLLGIALAIGYLSKQMMLVFPLLWLGFLSIEKTARPLLKRAVTWMVLLLPLLALVPPLLWNARHDWITLEHTSGHFAARSFTLMRSLGWIGEFLGTQLGLVSPVSLIIVVICLVWVAGQWKRQPPGVRYLWMFSAPALLVFTLLACRQRILPNWPAVYYVSAMCLCGGLLFGGTPGALAARLVKPFKLGLSLALLLVAFLYAAVYLTPRVGFARDPLERIRGWEAYGQAIAEVDVRLWPDRQGIQDKRGILVVGHRYYASQLAFYHTEQPRVHLYNPPGRLKSQYGIWEQEGEAAPEDVLIINARKELELPEGLMQKWKRIERVDTLSIPVASGSVRTVHLYKGSNRPET